MGIPACLAGQSWGGSGPGGSPIFGGGGGVSAPGGGGVSGPRGESPIFQGVVSPIFRGVSNFSGGGGVVEGVCG